MRAAAEFLGEISHGDHSHTLSVFLSEQSHRTALLRFFNAHHLRGDRQIFRDFLIDNRFNALDFVPCHRLTVGEVKTCALRILIGACLFNMFTEHLAQCTVQKMRRGMIAARFAPLCLIHAQLCLITRADQAAHDMSGMSDPSARELNGFFNGKFSVRSDNLPDVSLLAAHRCIERCLSDNNSSFFAFRQSPGEGFGIRGGKDLILTAKCIVAGSFSKTEAPRLSFAEKF